jgi:RimJ/RimL family protein N-acetyltransferase
VDDRRDPPYRIETERLVVRCWEPRDAPLLKEAVDASLDHLLPWLPWAAAEPQTVAEKVQLLRGFRGRFDLGQDFVYGIFSADESQALGGTGLHTRPAGSVYEIGYWIRADRVREGLVTEACAALTRVAFELCGVDRVLIRVDPANEASLGVPRKLGYLEEATLRRRLAAVDGELRDLVLFTLFRSAYPGSPAAEAVVTAYDATGNRLL